MKQSFSFRLLQLLLFSFSVAASPLEDVQVVGEILVEDPGDADISTQILSTNNNSTEILLEGDLLVPRTRNAMFCWSNNCLWRKSADGYVRIPYVVSSAFSNWDRWMMDRAMQAFHDSTCLRFVPRHNEQDFISIENRDGCFSSLGRAGGAQVLSLNRQGCLYHGIIQHEISHALGFQHEQNRSDRDQYVRINWDNINPRMAYNFHKQYTNNLDTPYDYSSIMHYGRTAFSVQYGKDSITPIPDPTVQIGQRQGLSRIDILRINRLYGC